MQISSFFNIHLSLDYSQSFGSSEASKRMNTPSFVLIFVSLSSKMFLSFISSLIWLNYCRSCILFFFLQGCRGQTIESIPSAPIVKMPGETLSLSCRGSGFPFGSFGMNWVKQSAGKGLEWMGYVYTDGSNTYYSSSFQGRIEITRDNSISMVYLKLSNIRPADSAVYYCARRAHWLKWVEKLNKNST